ncbi:ATP-binding protein [Desulfosarcina sp.]|nr:ATP-binding protein [Desulfosarcina sp.]
MLETNIKFNESEFVNTVGNWTSNDVKERLHEIVSPILRIRQYTINKDLEQLTRKYYDSISLLIHKEHDEDLIKDIYKVINQIESSQIEKKLLFFKNDWTSAWNYFLNKENDLSLVDYMHLIQKKYNITTQRYLNPRGNVKLPSELINKVVNNLVSNSIEHAFTKGEKAKPINFPSVDFMEYILYEVNEKEDLVEVRIGNNGNVIPEEVLKKLSYEIYSTKEYESSVKGNGLIEVRKTVEKYKGKFWITSSKEDCTFFNMLLPYKKIEQKTHII